MQCMLNRRLATGLLLGACFNASALAQRVARVGWLSLSNGGLYDVITARGFVQGLREAGFVEGANLVFERRSAQGEIYQLRALARDLVLERVDVIFAPAKILVDAAWSATRRIPTVIATVTDPVVLQYANSLAMPGKHITGVTTANAELIGKRLQLLTELVPGLVRVGVPIDADLLASCSEEIDLMEAAALRLGLTLVRVPIKASAPDLKAWAFEAASRKVQAVMTAPMTSNYVVLDRLAGVVLRERLPFVHDIPQLAGDALAVYGPDFEDIFRRAGHYVARILKGELPALMPIEEPRSFRLIVNLKTARQIGLNLPKSVLLRADEVIS